MFPLAPNEEFIPKEPGAFFPPLSISKTKKPYSTMVDNYHKKVERSRTTLEENHNGRISASSPKSMEHRLEDKVLIDLINSEETPVLAQSDNKVIAEIESIEKLEEKAHKESRDQETQTSAELVRNSKKRKTVNLSTEIKDDKINSKTTNTENPKPKRAKSKSRASEGKAPSTISPILEDRFEDQEEIDFNDVYSKRGNTNDELSMDLDINDKHLSSSLVMPSNLTKSPRIHSERVSLSGLEKKAPYFISGGFIPNSILIKILWPPSVLNNASEKEKSFWKPKALSVEQMEQFNQQTTRKNVCKFYFENFK